jgi:hypothetical protein
MPKAYVGIASPLGLTALQPERDDTLVSLHRSSGEEIRFWAVLGDTDARCVRALVLCGRRQEALWLLDRSAKELGRIDPRGIPRGPAH